MLKINENENVRVCTRCLMDTTASSVTFDENGVCNYCRIHDRLLLDYTQDESSRLENLMDLIDKIKNSGKGKTYDCIVGISGGTDSTYTLMKAKEYGLRPLAVYFDNGWGSDISVSNIKNATNKLGVDLFTYVVDWQEFKSLQKAFLYASVPCVDIPTDVAIAGTLFKLASKYKVKYVLSGASFLTEGMVPPEWSYIDGIYVSSVNGKYGNGKLKSYPNATIFDIGYYTFFKGIKFIPFTNYFAYNKSDAREILEKELGWVYYGGHHYENVYSHWAFGWYTYNKFGFDKRKVSLSGPLRMNLITREQALNEIASPPPVKPEVTDYVLKKLDLDKNEFEKIMNSPNKSFHDYKTGYDLLKKFKYLVKFAVNRKILSPVVYYKYYGTT